MPIMKTEEKLECWINACAYNIFLGTQAKISVWQTVLNQSPTQLEIQKRIHKFANVNKNIFGTRLKQDA